MTASELAWRSLAQTSEDLAARKISSPELTKAMLERIDRLDGRLRSYLTVTADVAMAQAAAAEREIAAGRRRGPLHGIPIALKDLCFTKGIATSAGMAIHRGFVPDYDATVTARLASAGSVLLGKLHMTEGATLEHHPELPPPVNPWGKELWTGVSSSGSGVATAAGLCFGSLGSDTGGSIRFPSAANALTGVKPTWGRVSRYGIFDLAASYDHIGPMARSAEDAAILLEAIAGADDHDPTSLTAPVPRYHNELAGLWGARGARIGFDHDFNASGTTGEVASHVRATAAVFADLGAEIRDVAFPDPAPLYARLLDLQLVELAVAHEATFPSQADRYGPGLADFLAKGRAVVAVNLGRGAIERDKFRGRLAKLFENIDALIVPVLGNGTPTWDEVAEITRTDMAGFMRYTAAFNATGSPSVTLPCGFTSDGRPIGFQLIGPHLSEDSLLRFAHAYQLATDWHLKRPPVG
jgi:amidase